MGYLVGDNFRIRFSIHETAGGNPPNQAYSLYYRQNGGTWTAVGGSAADSPLRAFDSPNVTDGASTTQQISSGTFTAGSFEESGSDTASLDFPASVLTELEWSLIIYGGASSPFSVGDVIDLRVQVGSTAFGTYTNTAQFTVIAASIPPTRDPWPALQAVNRNSVW